MHHCVFAAPFAMDSTLRFVEAVAAQPDIRVAVISQEPKERLPERLRDRLHAFARVPDCLDADQLVRGVHELAPQMDRRIDSLIGILEPLQEPLAQARQQLGLPGLSPQAATNFRDKAQMKNVLRAHDLPCAGHALAGTTQEAVRAVQALEFPLVVKPPAGAGAKQTFRVENVQQLESYLKSMPPRADAPVLFEEFITGDEFSFDSVSIGGRHVFSSISCYAPTPLEVMQSPWIQWSVMLPRDVSGPEYQAIHEAGPRALSALGMDTGMTHMEWFRKADGSIAISEVAARPPGAQFVSLMSWAHDRDFYSAWARLVTLGEFDPPERRWATGAAYLRGQGSGKVTKIDGLERAHQELGTLVVEAKLPKPGQPAASSYEGEGFVILRHEDTEAVAQGLRRLVELIRVELG